ncbi:MAG: 2,3-bisphosphoglycerate-independent phosphoglycerate mutase [Candidatus Magasanikbacteria bacterium]
MAKHYRPVVLTIFDGWGVAPPSEGNAITKAKTPNFSEYLKNYPAMTLYASGNEVGLLFGEIGNSEVGHLNIGAGRVYYQSCPRINQSIADGSFFENQAFLRAIEHAKTNHSSLHLIGMLSSGNVHSSMDHLYALLELCKRNGLNKQVYVHAILDGRDCGFNLGVSLIKDLRQKLATLQVGQIATISGRFYALDRDNRWQRVERAYHAMALGQSEKKSADPEQAVMDSYNEKVYDEEFVPTVITDMKGAPVGSIEKNDAAIFFNFRPDRARELTKAFVLPAFTGFERDRIENLFFVTMMEYEKNIPVVVAYEPIVVHNCLAEVISKNNLKQIHIAETEKYGHVTFFLNGTVEEQFPGEDRVLVPSPRIGSYAELPEMSAPGVTKEAIKAIDSGNYDFVVINFANADMVGHTGNLQATIAACEAADIGLGEVVKHTLAHEGVVIFTADHGNAEELLNLQTTEMDKEHSVNPVPCVIIGDDFRGQAGPGGDPPEGDLSLLAPVGVLADIAPTVLKLLDIEQPPEMTGVPLI